jgi:hypothetical protein
MLTANLIQAIHRKLLAEVEAKIASAPGIEARIGQILWELDNEAMELRDGTVETKVLTESQAESPRPMAVPDSPDRLVAQNFIYATKDPLQYWDHVARTPIRCEEPLPASNKHKLATHKKDSQPGT